MNKQDLLNLEKNSSLTPEKIKAQQPALHAKLSEPARAAMKKRVERMLRKAPKEIRESLSNLDFSKLDKKDVKVALAASVKKGTFSAAKKKELATALSKLPNLGKVEEAVLPDVPVFVNPVYAKDLQKARVYRLSDVAGLSEAKTSKALEKDLNLNTISGTKLDELVKGKVLTRKEADNLGLAANLYSLFDSNFELVEYIKKNHNAQSVQDLTTLNREAWLKAINESKMELPKGMKPEQYAEILYKKVEKLFPESSIGRDKVPVNKNKITQLINALKPLLKNNKNIFSVRNFAELNTKGIPAAQLKKIQAAHGELSRIARIHPGFKLDEVLNDTSATSTDQGKVVTERVGLFDKFVENNKEVDFLALDYKHDSKDVDKLNFQGFKPQEREMVLSSVKSYQRVYSFTEDIEDTKAVLAAGYHSSMDITASTLPEFIEATKLDTATATQYFENAHMTVVRTTGVMGSILDVLTGSFDWTAVGNSSPGIENYLRDIPGYQDFFGNLAFCDCQHCQSIYSPAAYFVDLMEFVERYVTSKYFTGSDASDVLNLKVRRPDLWTLPLTCENTDTLVPYLDIINEILESYIAKKKGFSGDLNDRAAVEDYVYAREIAIEKPGVWKNSVHAFTQPFFLPLESTSIYLGHFEKTRADIAQLLEKPLPEISKARLNLADKGYQLITTVDKSPAFIKRVYGITFSVASGKIKPFNAQLLLKPMGVSRSELGKVLGSRFVTNNGADAIVIQSEKIDSNSVQNDIERVKNLTYAALDRAHRFVRLWRKVGGWSIEELDLILTQLDDSGTSTGINANAVTAIGNLLRLQALLGISVEELAGIWHRLPQTPVLEGQKSLLDTLFNHDDVVATEGTYPKVGTKMIHPTLLLDESTNPAEFSSARLMAALNRSDDEVLELIAQLAKFLGVVDIASPTEHERGFDLTVENLSLLYRHSQLADILSVTVAELFRLIRLVPELSNGHVENAAQIYNLINFYDWWQASTFSLDDLNYIIESGDLAAPENYPAKEDVMASVLDQVVAANALTFADTLFASFDAITESQSKEIISANGGVIEATPDGGSFWLKPDYNPAQPLTIPAGITKPEPEIREVLNQYHPNYLIPFYLSGQLDLSEEVLASMIAALGVDLDKNPYTLELQAGTSPANQIEDAVGKLLPLSILFKDSKFTAEVVAYVLANLSVFGINDLDKIKVQSIRRLHDFLQYVIINADGSGNVATLTEVLDAYANATQYKAADQDKLAAVLGAKPEQLPAVHSVVSTANNAITALENFKKIVEVCNHIGVGAEVLPKIISTSYSTLNEATTALLAAFRSKYKTESERLEKLEPYQDILRGRKRSALTTYLIHSGFPQFENTNDLFHYFLIDTELEGCARTSRLVAATMSLQLYIHRILLNLEQDDQEPGTAGRIHVLADSIPADEWVWRKNYRVWEANRKVFLYPENYIEPELRDNKTPLFDELENELLQQEVNADTVLEAYAKYMRGFDEVAHLKIAGSYHEKDPDSETDVLHLFGVTADEPPMFYYRRVDNIYYAEKNDNRGIVWGAWQKINVQIPVRKVAPITYNGRLHVFWVRVTTLSNTVFDENRSIFTGYSHKFSIEFTTLKLDGNWTPPQKLNLKNCYPFTGNGVVQDPLAEDEEKEAFQDELHDILRSFPFFDFSNLSDEIMDLKTPRYDFAPHYDPVDEYTLEGPLWDQVFPYVDSSGRMVLTGAAYQMRAAIDFYNLSTEDHGVKKSNVTGFADPAMEMVTIAKNKPGKIVLKSGRNLYKASSPNSQLFDNYAYGSLLVNTTKSDKLLQRHWSEDTLDASFDDVQDNHIARMADGTIVQVINGAYGDVIIDDQGDLLLLQGTPVEGNDFLLKRLGTTLSETLTRTLFTSGVETTLSIETQKALKEAPSPISIISNRIENLVVRDKIDFTGPYGTYYREIFFHIPFLLANHLNSQGKYAEAQHWYHYIFNPGATEVIDFSAPGLTAAEKKKMALDRNWQYLEFRDIDAQKLREQLNDKQAIEVYKKDPFNPHAIARLRMSAYQKSIIMKYIDNLLDWGDQLFTQDSMESINQATLLYIIAKEIMGDRPAEIGDCGEGKVNPKTYENIAPLLAEGSEFLAELESYTIVRTPSKYVRPDKKMSFIETNMIAHATHTTYNSMARSKTSTKANTYGLPAQEYNQLVEMRKEHLPKVNVKPVDDAVTGAFAVGTIRAMDWKKDSMYVRDKYKVPSFGRSLIKQISPVFCIPGNTDLLAYYDRVDDRLFKIRNCMNILGQVRQIALFQPPIDPRLLVRAAAAGLSLDDILNSISGNLPPYRFAYILERAKAFTTVVQSFGASLLSAIEKQSSQELTVLRLTQQQNILEMAAKSRLMEIDSANEGIAALSNRIEALTYQIGYYEALVAERINEWEKLQSVGRHTASIIRGTEAAVATVAGILSLIPQIGSPFAMKYGGVELGGSMGKFAFAMSSLADLGENVAASAGLEGGFTRRSDGWTHQKKLMEYELQQVEKNLIASEIRRDMLIEAEAIHQKNIEHNQEVLDFHGERFSNLGLYTWLSSTMQGIFKEAYNNALAIARLAEQAYKYERDDSNIFIDGTYFDASRAGLLSGERLQMALQTMERKYLETNYRKSEIDQPFSLTQIDPAALLLLKETGTCEFSIPEVFFDLFYPGQYRRKIQSVRLTIPSVTGPYTNVSATLSLTGSQIRMEPLLGAAALQDVPKARTTTIATSTAQNDAGVFQINFRDDRYMPFEGSGAVSSWKLSLPKNFRQFDYSTINDVIVHVSYVADYDELFRDKVEEQNDAIEGTLLNILKNNPLARTFSFRQEFSHDFHRLTEQPVNQPILVKIQNKHFPLFMNGRTLKVAKAKLILVTPEGQTAAGVDISIDGTSQTGFAKDPALGNLFSKDLGTLFNGGIIKDHTISIIAGGDLAPAPAAAGPTPAIDSAKLEDMILYVEYKVEP